MGRAMRKKIRPKDKTLTNNFFSPCFRGRL